MTHRGLRLIEFDNDVQTTRSALRIPRSRRPYLLTRSYKEIDTLEEGFFNHISRKENLVLMITTNELHEVIPFSFMHTPGFKSWRTAGLNILKPYYLMSFACKEGRNWTTQGMILWCEKDLLGFCNEANQNSLKKIFQITKLTPPKPGSAEIWTPIAVKEVWQNLDDGPTDVLIVENNFFHQQSAYLTSNKSKKMKKVFPIS